MVTLPQRIHLDAANILMITKIGSKITKCQMHNYRNQRRDSKYSHSTWVFQQNSRFIQCCPNFLTAIMMMYVRTGPPFLGRRQCDYDKNLFLIKKNSRKTYISYLIFQILIFYYHFSQVQENVMQKCIEGGVGVPHDC